MSSNCTSAFHSCEHCRKIIIKEPARPGKYGFRCRLPYTTREAWVAFMDKCPVYKMLLKGYIFATSPDELNMLARAVLGKPDVRLPRNGVYGEQERIIYLAESLSKHPFQVRFDDQGSAVFGCLTWGSHWYPVSTLAGSLLSLRFPVRPINRHIASATAFQVARQWLNDCVHHGPDAHQLCAGIDGLRFTPKRLLEIHKRQNQFIIRLRLSTESDHLKYACLSYCWGGDQPLKLTVGTLEQRMADIGYSELPRTLRDAIHVANQLDLSYIWIDCLCMIQDDEKSMLAELPMMPEIYKNSYVTISASSASTCQEGFLQRRYRSAMAECDDIALQYQSSTGEHGNIYLFDDELAHSASQDPIDKRAWTFQERRLSPRLLDFSSQQLRWTCKSRQSFDGGLKTIHFEDKATEGFSKNSQLPANHTATHAIFQSWTSIVDDYTKRKLSFPGDKLVALAALASEMGHIIRADYLAGLWRHHLPSQLLWRLWDRALPRPTEYRAPSWSWASIDGWIMMEHDAHEERVAIVIVDCSTELQLGGFAYGPVTAASLTLTGRLLPAYWWPNRDSTIALEGDEHNDLDQGSPASLTTGSDSDTVDTEMTDVSSLSGESNSDEATSSCIDADYVDGAEVSADAVWSDWDHEDPDLVVEVRCLQILGQKGTEGVAGILLVMNEPGASTYQRAGYFYFEPRKRDLFQDIDEQTITIV